MEKWVVLSGPTDGRRHHGTGHHPAIMHVRGQVLRLTPDTATLCAALGSGEHSPSPMMRSQAVDTTRGGILQGAAQAAANAADTFEGGLSTAAASVVAQLQNARETVSSIGNQMIGALIGAASAALTALAAFAPTGSCATHSGSVAVLVFSMPAARVPEQAADDTMVHVRCGERTASRLCLAKESLTPLNVPHEVCEIIGKLLDEPGADPEQVAATVSLDPVVVRAIAERELGFNIEMPGYLTLQLFSRDMYDKANQKFADVDVSFSSSFGSQIPGSAHRFATKRVGLTDILDVQSAAVDDARASGSMGGAIDAESDASESYETSDSVDLNVGCWKQVVKMKTLRSWDKAAGLFSRTIGNREQDASPAQCETRRERALASCTMRVLAVEQGWAPVKRATAVEEHDTLRDRMNEGLRRFSTAFRAGPAGFRHHYVASR